MEIIKGFILIGAGVMFGLAIAHAAHKQHSYVMARVVFGFVMIIFAIAV